MINLETKYLGLKLRNPLIISSSGLTNSPENVKRFEDLGAGAVILKSIFEEQIRFEAHKLLDYNDYPEAADYIVNYSKKNSLNEYLKLVEDCKKTVKIPVLASVNCVSSDEWISFAKQIESAGADAIEVNIHILPTDRNLISSAQEKNYHDIVRKITKLVKIPIAVKIGSQFSNLVYFVDQLYANGAKGVVLFNRFYEPDIDIDNLKIVSSEVFSSPADIRNSLRWVAILSSKSKNIDISASTGVHDGKGAIKQLLAGADTVQVCSTLYKNGIGYFRKILDFVEEWIHNSGFDSVDAMRGKMNYLNIKDPGLYERTQFMKYFSSIE
jgi:dihydroorotate dehydrogenase (fumarate)